MLIKVVNCSRQSRSANFPSSSFFCMAFCLSGLAIATSCLQGRHDGRGYQIDSFCLPNVKGSAHMCSKRPCISPIPSNFEMNGEGTNRSRSLKFSPTPKKMMGVLVAATLPHRPSSDQVSHKQGRPRVQIPLPRAAGNSRRNGSTPLGVPVQLGHDDRPEIRTLLERPTLAFRRLPDRSVEDHDRHVLPSEQTIRLRSRSGAKVRTVLYCVHDGPTRPDPKPRRADSRV